MLRGQRKPGQRWLGRDAALAVALTQFEALLCPSCGQPLPESMDPETEDDWVAGLPSRCHACTAIAHRAKDYENAIAPQALRFGAERKHRHTAAPDRTTWPGVAG